MDKGLLKLIYNAIAQRRSHHLYFSPLSDTGYRNRDYSASFNNNKTGTYSGKPSFKYRQPIITDAYQMPCTRPIVHRQRRFLPHFPPGLMRCRFSPELVSPLPHTMRKVFSKSEDQPTDGSLISPPSTSSRTQTKSVSLLIPKPRGEVSRVGRGGYTLKNVLEQDHGWKDGLYHSVRVRTTDP